MSEFSCVGRSLPKVDVLKKALGETVYTGDIKLPGMLYGRVLKSPHPHAKILRVDTAGAEKLKGVKAVVTHRDAPRILWGTHVPPYCVYDQYVFDSRVRFVGEPVAAVAAVDEDVAEEALELINVDYEVLPAVYDPEEAMKPDAPQLHPEIPGVKNNVAKTVEGGQGNVEKGLKEAYSVFEDRYATSRVAHCCLERHVCVCSFDRAGKLTVWSPTQNPFSMRSALAKILGMPLSMVRCMVPSIGGGFGAKSELIVEPFAALLAKKTGRPVKMEYSREEVFSATRTRHPCIVELKTGVTRDGLFTARVIKAVFDTGAYASHGPCVVPYGLGAGVSLYRCPNVKYVGYCVYTNTPVAGAFRGYGNPQINFAVESQIDLMAEELGIDPKEFRLKNHVRSGDVTAIGWQITSCGIEECVRKGAERIGWDKKRKTPKGAGGKARGVGMASMIHSTGYCLGSDTASAMIKLNEDGTVTLITGAPDIGQGSDTVLAQMVAEELGIRVRDVYLITADTDICPYDYGVYASKTTFIVGNAVKATAAEVKRQLLEVAARMLDAKVEDLEAGGQRIYVKRNPSRSAPISDVIRFAQFSEGRTIMGKADYDTPNTESPDVRSFYGRIAPTHPFGAQFAEVEVNTETGDVKVLKMVSAYDVGRAINPQTVEGQIEGALHQGIGYALTEEILLDEKGIMLNPNFRDYKLLTSADMPEAETVIVESIDPDGPYGAKGVGEPGLVPTAAAIANAVYNATGVRIRDLPLTAEKILKALRKV
ncbi:xanthine dehydrogenase family protein molybdopterin-binding subunit [Candidatus Hecatella orcuttiae]|jgi:xanthine dehydrogenase molybdenum-binding subunit|uniref:xanthine dehydrogenase family protein molybdopterin-binding subunit n=1 Tax=Candidatus Hecatella orcuttiae TaxID=1935119 RepID=UPI00286838D9|nr:molybdopterin cofactor-binding domain-containing protein [Candidatus Hecatella orcuttiae]